MMTVTNDIFNADLRICEEQGVPIYIGAFVDSVLMAFSLCRTLTEFTRDLYEVPDLVEAAMRASCDDLIANAIQVCRGNGKNVAWIVLERGSGFYYRLEVFGTVRMAISAALRPCLHRRGHHPLAAPGHGLAHEPALFQNCPGANASLIWTAPPTFSGPRKSSRAICASAAMSPRPCFRWANPMKWLLIAGS